MKRRLWGSVVVVTVTALLCGGTPTLPVRADTQTAQPAPGGDWKPASKRGFLDRLLGRHDSLPQPGTRDTTVQAVPRREPAPVSGKPAPPAKRVRELTGRRTANARFWQLSDGRTQEELSQEPINYRSGHGWNAIDTTVRRTTRSGFAYGNETNSFRSYFGSKPGELARVEQGGASVTIGLDGKSTGSRLLGAPKVDGDTVSYADTASGATLVYQVTPDGLKERIVLAKPPAVAPSWSFTVRTGGLRAWQRPDGSIGFYRGDTGGQPLFVMPKPFMTDSRPDGASPYGKAWSSGVAQTMRWDAAAGLLRVRVNADASWLADHARAYPVTIDPTIKIQPLPESTQDTMITSDDPASNFESSWRLSVGTTTTGTTRSLVKFPLTGVPAGTPIDSADLQLYYDQYHTDNSQPVTIEAHRATAAWDESTATWNDANNNVGELGNNSETVDDGDAGKTAAVGAWPASTNGTLSQYGVNGDYVYNKDAVAGDSYTWVPRITEDGDYRVEVHYVAAGDRATNAPYTVTYSGGTKAYTVNQQTGTSGVWTTLGTHPFAAGSTGKVVLGDGPASTSTAVIADAVRLTKDGSVVRPAGDQGSHWHTFPVRNIVQSWVNGTNPNYGFVLKAKDEATPGMGGPRYEGGVYNYGGETEQYPRLVITYGRPGVSVNSPTTIHATGAELTWPAYKDPSGSTADDIVEYQVHRSIFQTFTPSAATLVAPVAPGTRAFTDSTATPTPADSADPFGRLYYYMVAVKTRDGQLIAGPTQIVRLPKAGRVVKVFQAGTDTTLTSAQPTTNQDRLAGQPWIEVGDNSTTYGKARAVLKFPISGIPTSATVLDARFDLWTVEENGGATATYEAHGLTRDFAETTATWNSAASGTAWTTPGGDYTAAAAGSVTSVTNDPARRSIHAASLVQGWITTPSSNHGALVKLANETSPAERTVFLSSEAEEPDLQPTLVVSYIEPTAEDTYYAPATPSLTTPATTYPVDVTLTNPTAATWTKADWVLSYRWTLPDGTDVTSSANQVQTALPKDIVAGDTVTVPAQVTSPTQADPANNRTDYTLNWDLFNKTTGQWLSGFGGTPAAPSGGATTLAAGGVPIPSLPQKVAVDEPTSDQLGLEKFYEYFGKNTGAGGVAMTNLYSGNTVWSYDALTNPGRGISTFLRMAYNSLDTSDSSMGFGWSLQATSLMRLGSPLDFHPNPNTTSVTLTDGDGTSHLFTWDSATSTWIHPKGVHLFLQQIADCKPGNDKDSEPRAWQMTRPDRTQFIFGCDGYLNAIVDKNGNEADFVWTQRHSANKPTKFLSYITDPAGRQTLTLTYYAKGDSYTWIDDTGAKQPGSNLTNPFIIDHVKQISDIAGRKITFTYTDKGLMAEMVDGAGDPAAKTFRFAYDMTQGNKNVKLVKVTDPRGHDTKLDYYSPQTGDDPQFHWRNKTITDRLGGLTQYAYTDPDGPQGSTIRTQVTDAENHTSIHLMDGFGRPTQTTNAKNQTTKLTWDTDHNVARLEEPPASAGAVPGVTTWTYDANTGYPLTMTDAEANKNGTPGTVLTYQTGLNGHIADLIAKKSPEGRLWTFGYNATGNLTSVTDPNGNATSAAGDYTTTYTYDAMGQLLTTTDANGHTTTNSNFDPNGYPQTITDADPRHNVTKFLYDPRGNVTQVTDPLGHDTTQAYDIFERPGQNTAPKNQAAGEVITTPAPVYDANDNVVQSTAANGAVSTATYNDTDDVVASVEPPDTSSSPERRTTYTYDRTGHVTSVTQPKGSLTTGDSTDFVTTYGYDSLYEQTSVTDANGDTLTYGYDDVGNVVITVDPKKNASSDPSDFTTKYTYDLDHRVTASTDAAGKTTGKTYDRDGLLVATTDQDGTTTQVTLDARGMPIQVKQPHADGVDDVTQYEYDQVGNQTKVITPRGVATGSVTNDFVAETTYDELNRVKEKITPFDPGDSRYNTPDKTIYTYDPAGRVAKVSAPPSNGQAVRNDTTYGYFDNGWIKTSTDPWDIVTTYDYNAIGQQTSRTITSAGGSSSRTMGWQYYPDGKLKSRSDDGVPVGLQVALVDDSDTQNAGSTGGTWTSVTTGTGFQGYDYATHPAGTGTSQFVWNLTIPQDGDYTVYARYPAGISGAASNASYTVHAGGGAAARTVDQTTGGGTWVSLGTYAFTRDGTGQQVALSDDANGTVLADAVKLVRDNAGEADNEKQDFTYGYDPNGNLTGITDASPGTKIDDYVVTYDALDQVAKVEEKKSGVVQHTTTFTYDANGNPRTRGHDAESATYEYNDPRDLPTKITDKETSTDPSPKVTTFTYTSRGQRDIETKGNGNTVDYDYFLDDALRHQVEKKPDGTVVAEDTYSYDANGNKTQDIAKKMNADNHSAYLNTTTAWTYDPQDRIATLTKTGDGAETESYVHDANNNVVSQTIKGATTTFNYDRNRLLSSTTGGVTSAYNYDPFGRLDTVTAAGQLLERNTYDGFDHIAEHQQRQSSGALSTTKYTYDPLDRTATETTNAGGAGEKTTGFNYLGTTGDVLSEDVSGEITRTYQYTPWGERLSQVKSNTDGSKEDGYYGYNDHTDVQDVTDSSGNTKATYGYTAYGQSNDSESTGIDKPDPQDPTREPYNAYRYNAKRFDPASGTYDMGFRDYDPGLNQFLSRDTYNGALADMNLVTDPFTGNRYAFAGGNPTSNIEYDGHCSGYNPMSCAWDALDNAFQKHVMQPFDNAVTGFADTWTFGATKWLRNTLYGDDDGVDEDSGWYKFGEWGAVLGGLVGAAKGGIRFGLKVLLRRGGEDAFKGIEGVAKVSSAARLRYAGRVGKVAFGSTDLAKVANDYRKAHNLRGATNVAVFEFKHNGRYYTIARESQRGVGHAERRIASELAAMGVKPDEVTRIYSELSPCDKMPGGFCKQMIERQFSKAKVTWSFDYPGGVGKAADAARKAAVDALKKAIDSLF